MKLNEMRFVSFALFDFSRAACFSFYWSDVRLFVSTAAGCPGCGDSVAGEVEMIPTYKWFFVSILAKWKVHRMPVLSLSDW